MVHGIGLGSAKRPRQYAQSSVHSSASSLSRTWLISIVLVALLCVCRLWLADTLALTDTTEARYAEIARKMVETGDWLMPQHRYGVPYLAKPPFAFWLSAIGIKLLGANQLAVRLPIIVWCAAFCVIFYGWLRRSFDSAAAAAGLSVLSSTLLFFASAAAVMTDMILTISVALALMAFWSRLHGGRGSTEAGMYVAIGIGLLAKGPLAAVLVLCPISLWALMTGQIGKVWRNFSWLRGACLTAVIAMPWYLAAEWQHPGFLRYFILGEHFGRFLIPGWSGDLYGFAHDMPYGTIWVFFLFALLPWPILLVPCVFSERARLPRAWNSQKELILFAVVWAATPLALFTASANVIWPYALPALPGAVVALVALLTTHEQGTRRLMRLGWIAAMMVMLGAFALHRQDALFAAHTKKQIIAQIRMRHPDPNRAIYYWGGQYYSAEFYSQGQATPLETATDIANVLSRDQDFSLIARADDLASLRPTLRSQLSVVSGSDGVLVLEPLETPRRSSTGRGSKQISP